MAEAVLPARVLALTTEDEWRQISEWFAQHFIPEARRATLADVHALASRIIDIHAQVVMDTPEDRALHDAAVASMRLALEAIAPRADALTAEGTGNGASGSVGASGAES